MWFKIKNKYRSFSHFILHVYSLSYLYFLSELNRTLCILQLIWKQAKTQYITNICIYIGVWSLDQSWKEKYMSDLR